MEKKAPLSGFSFRRYESACDRREARVATLIIDGHTERLKIYLQLAKENGITEEQLIEEVIHLGCYTGWPKAMKALDVIKEVFYPKEKGAME